MAVVWGTVNDHKGYIEVESHHGKGTKICLYFPVSNQIKVKDINNFKLENYMGNKETILVVDDEENQREIASKILSKLNYSVSTAQSGEDAVLYAKNNNTDLLVLDMIMEPGIDGLETYKKILNINPYQKAVVTSGFSETKRMKEVQRIGTLKYIKKPYSIENIAIAIKLILNPTEFSTEAFNPN